MNVFAGIVGKKDRRFNDDIFHSSVSSSLFRVSGEHNTSFAGDHFSGIVSGKGCLHYVEKTTGLQITGEAELYERSKLASLLGLDAAKHDLQLILAAYKKWGNDCAGYINGDFSFAIVNETERSVYCARDPLGNRPLFYYDGDGYFLFSNWLQSLSSFSIAKDLDEDWIWRFLQFGTWSFEDTIFKQVKRLLPGHCMVVTDSRTSHYRYWDITKAAKPQVNNIEQGVEGLRQHLSEAVKMRIGNAGNTGVELTGGLDSISIATLVQNNLKNAGKSIKTAFTNVLPDEYKASYENYGDEWQQAQRMSKLLGIPGHTGISEYIDGPIENIKRVLDTLGTPSSSIFAISQEKLFATAANNRIDILFSGFGGNEAVSEHAAVRYIFNLVKQGYPHQLYGYFKGQGVSTARALVRTGYQYYAYLLNKEGKNLGRVKEQRWQNSLLQDELRKIIKNDYHTLSIYPANQTVEERCLFRLADPSIANRIESSYFFTAKYGIKYHHPLLDVSLLEYYYHLPAAWKATNIDGRSLLRKAMKNLVPDDVITQQKSPDTSTIPFFKVHFEKAFEVMKEWCLALPADHRLFDYIDRRKVVRTELLPAFRDKYPYYLLRCAVMLAMFFDERNSIVLNEL